MRRSISGWTSRGLRPGGAAFTSPKFQKCSSRHVQISRGICPHEASESFGHPSQQDVSGPHQARKGEKKMKTRFLTIALAVATAFVLSPSAAIAKKTAAGTAKTA